MRIIITSQGDDLEALVDSRFGRAQKFLLVDTETMAFEVIENAKSMNLSKGAGIQASQDVIARKPDVVLTGHCGPKAFGILQAAGVDVVVGVSGKIRDAVQLYMEGKYQPADEANVDAHWV